MKPLAIHRIVSPPLDTCAYLAADAESARAIAIDPSCAADDLLGAAEQRGWQIEAVVLTHEHIDHIHDAARLARMAGAPVMAHADALPALRDPLLSGAMMLGMSLDAVEDAQALHDGASVQVGNLAFRVYHTPGHSPGSICLSAVGHCFTGDLLFRGGVGRWDLPGGDQAVLIESLRRLAAALPDDTTLHPGHGGETTLERERRDNPFLLEWLGA